MKDWYKSYCISLDDCLSFTVLVGMECTGWTVRVWMIDVGLTVSIWKGDMGMTALVKSGLTILEIWFVSV